MATLAAITLLWPGTTLDRVWRLNPAAYAQLAPKGHIFGPLFVLLTILLLFAAIGWFRRRLWGWRLTVAIIAIQIIGDLVNCIQGDFLRGPIGLVIATALLFYLLHPSLKRTFS